MTEEISGRVGDEGEPLLVPVLVTARELKMILGSLRGDESDVNTDERDALVGFLEETTRQWLVEHRSGLAALRQSQDPGDRRRAGPLAAGLEAFTGVLPG